MMSQFSLFGAAAAEPSLDDLDGLLLAGARWVHRAGRPRLSIVVADSWRADALAEELVLRGVAEGLEDATVVEATEGWSVRTDFTPALTASATRWTRGSREGVPADFALTAGGVRLWALAAGDRDDAGYLFRTRRAEPPLHLAAGAQLSRQGLAAVSISQRPGPGWRVTSTRRIRRLAELVGPAPPGGSDHWPGLPH